MKKRVGIYVGIAYALLIGVLASVAIDGIAALIPMAACVICAVGIIWHIYIACRQAIRGEDSRGLICQCFWTKIWLIPLYMLVFIWGVGLALVPFGFLMIPFAVALDYIILLGSSSYGIAGLIRAKREGKISFKTMVIHIVLQLLFCLDFISICIWMQRQKKWTV